MDTERVAELLQMGDTGREGAMARARTCGSSAKAGKDRDRCWES